MFRTERLILAHFGAAFVVLAIAIVLGPWQMAVRAGINPPFAAPETYFASVTAHGTIMGYMMPTFFIMAFGYFVAVTSLNRPLPSKGLAWAGFWIMIVGTIMALVPIAAGKASVLYTFYPPLTGSVFYYVGVALVVIGSWFWVASMIWALVPGRRPTQVRRSLWRCSVMLRTHFCGCGRRAASSRKSCSRTFRPRRV